MKINLPKNFIASLLFWIGLPTGFVNASNQYTLKMPAPHTHYFEVEMDLTAAQGNFTDVKMPVWAPGSYLIREFSKNVDFFEASSGEKPLKWEKVNKNTWRVFSGKNKDLHIRYKVYAYEMSVRTSFLDASHGYVNGTSVFMYTEHTRNKPGKLIIHPFENWKKVSVALPKVLESEHQEYFAYSFSDYDILADSPIEIGNHLTFSFEAAGVPHEVAMYGEGNFEVEQLKKDMSKVIEETHKVIGFKPIDNYLFIIHNLTQSSGGLEHLNSTTLQVNRWTYQGASYTGFLSLVVHEYFHLWNVKRIRPKELGPFDYDNENYTRLLWVMEGFTSYYDELVLRRSGYYSDDQYFKMLQGTINSVESRPGSKVQSAAESSFDAWIKGYRPNENSYNTEVSYYPKGHILGMLLDMIIIKESKGTKKLDDLMRYLFQEYYQKANRGFTEQEFKVAAEKIAGINLDGFFKKHVYGTETPDYQTTMSSLGLDMQVRESKQHSVGVRLKEENGKVIISTVVAGGNGYNYGLNVNDEILGCDGYRMNKAELENYLSDAPEGKSLDLLIARDNVILNIPVKLEPGKQTDYRISVSGSNNANQEKLRNFWLN